MRSCADRQSGYAERRGEADPEPGPDAQGARQPPRHRLVGLIGGRVAEVGGQQRESARVHRGQQPSSERERQQPVHPTVESALVMAVALGLTAR